MSAKEFGKGDEGPEITPEVQKMYNTRITIAKVGQAAYKENDFQLAIKNYNQYLAILARVKGTEAYTLSPKNFEGDRDMTEMLLISHVYWDLAKIYDLSPKLNDQFLKALSQFTKFTANMPYQVVNAEILRRFIKRGRCNNKEMFEKVYKQVYISTKKCFIASYAYSEDHPLVTDFRGFRDQLWELPLGKNFIRNYYKYSPLVVAKLEQHPIMAKALTEIIIKPCLNVIHKLIRFLS